MAKRFWLGILFALLATTQVLAVPTTWYADPAGSGTACTVGSPCTLTQCVNTKMAAGDTCSLNDGTYPALTISRGDSFCGVATRCTITATNPLGATIAGAATGNAISATGKKYWTIQNINVTMPGPCGGQAIAIDGESTIITGNHITIDDDCNATGISAIWSASSPVSGDTLTITNNTIEHSPGCQGTGSSAKDFAGSTGMYCWSVNNWNTVVVTGNTCKYTRNNNLFNISHLTLSKNLFVNQTNHGQVIIDVADLVAENNITEWDPSAACMDEQNDGDFLDTYCLKDARINNNMIVGHDRMREGIYHFHNGAVGNAPKCLDGVGPEIGVNNYEHLRYYNNVFYDNNPGSSSAAINFCINPQCPGANLTGANPKFIESHNYYGEWVTPFTNGGSSCPNALCYSTVAALQAIDMDGNGTGEGVGDVMTNNDPRANIFVDYEGRDYHHALADSVLVDIGVDDAERPCPVDDFDGNLRTDGLCDLGPYERVATCDNDGVKEAGEACDGFDFGLDNGGVAISCLSYGFTGGALTCDVTCQHILLGACTNAVSPWGIFKSAFIDPFFH